MYPLLRCNDKGTSLVLHSFQNHTCQSDQDQTTGKLRLRDYLLDTWKFLFKNIEVMKNKTKQTRQKKMTVKRSGYKRLYPTEYTVVLWIGCWNGKTTTTRTTKTHEWKPDEFQIMPKVQ